MNLRKSVWEGFFFKFYIKLFNKWVWIICKCYVFSRIDSCNDSIKKRRSVVNEVRIVLYRDVKRVFMLVMYDLLLFLVC